jgi:hypothetical protein
MGSALDSRFHGNDGDGSGKDGGGSGKAMSNPHWGTQGFG